MQSEARLSNGRERAPLEMLVFLVAEGIHFLDPEDKDPALT